MGRPVIDPAKIRRVAEHYIEQQRYADAITELDKIRQRDPGDLDVLRQIAALEVRVQAWGEALGTYRLLADQATARGERLLGLVAYRRLWQLLRGHAPDLESAYEDVPQRMQELVAEVDERRPTLSAYDEAARNLEQNGRDADALELLDRMMALEPSNPVFHVRRAEALCRLGQVLDALPVFRRAAELLLGFERPDDALRVAERVLHFEADPKAALLAARLYLDRGETGDGIRAVAKLSVCIQSEPDQLDALGLLARAFESIGQPERAFQVRKEIAKAARDSGDTELLRLLVESLQSTAPDDPQVLELAGHAVPQPEPPSRFRDTFASITEEDLVPIGEAMLETRRQGDMAPELSFDEVSVVSEVWVEPVVSKHARRALLEAEAFLKLGLLEKAELVLAQAAQTEPRSVEIREEYRKVLGARSRHKEYIDETLALAALYVQRRYEQRALELIDELLESDPENTEAQVLLERLTD